MEGRVAAGQNEVVDDQAVVHDDQAVVHDDDDKHIGTPSDGASDNGGGSDGSAASDPDAEATAAICRICHAEDGGRLLSPCGCAGSMRYVHARCLRAWRLANLSQAFACGVCGERYRPANGAGADTGATAAPGVAGYVMHHFQRLVLPRWTGLRPRRPPGTPRRRARQLPAAHPAAHPAAAEPPPAHFRSLRSEWRRVFKRVYRHVIHDGCAAHCCCIQLRLALCFACGFVHLVLGRLCVLLMMQLLLVLLRVDAAVDGLLLPAKVVALLDQLFVPLNVTCGAEPYLSYRPPAALDQGSRGWWAPAPAPPVGAAAPGALGAAQEAAAAFLVRVLGTRWSLFLSFGLSGGVDDLVVMVFTLCFNLHLARILAADRGAAFPHELARALVQPLADALRFLALVFFNADLFIYLCFVLIPAAAYAARRVLAAAGVLPMAALPVNLATGENVAVHVLLGFAPVVTVTFCGSAAFRLREHYVRWRIDAEAGLMGMDDDGEELDELGDEDSDDGGGGGPGVAAGGGGHEHAD